MGGSDELWQAYTEDGQVIAPDYDGSDPNAQYKHGLPKSAARQGVLHGASHVWMYRFDEDNELHILVQKRSDHMSTWPGYFDVSAAGHINGGETPVQAAVRETREEVGLPVTADELRLLFVNRVRAKVPASDIIENEIQFVYAVQVSEDADFQALDGEVSTVQWMQHRDIWNTDSGQNDTLVPHGNIYFEMLIERLNTFGRPEQA